MATKRRWSQAALENYRAANGGAYPVGQEPEPEDYTEKTGEDRARISYALAHGRATGADSAAARAYGILKDEKPEEPKTAAQILNERKASATLRYADAPERMSRADSVLAGIKEEKPKAGRSLIQAGQEYAKKQIDAQALLDAKNKDDGYIFLGGTPEEKNLQKVKQVYGDSSAILSRALETFGPENDQNELIGMFPVARQGLQEYGKMIKGKMPEAQAAAAIKAKYGYDPADLRKVHYVETGK